MNDGFLSVLVTLNCKDVKAGQPVLPPFEQNSSTFKIVVVALLTENEQPTPAPVNYEHVGLLFAT